MPDLTNRFLEGNGIGYIEAGLPNITGSTQFGDIVNVSYACAVTDTYGAFYGSTQNLVANVGTNSIAEYDSVFNFDASRSSSIYGNSDTVQPAACKCNFIIKF